MLQDLLLVPGEGVGWVRMGKMWNISCWLELKLSHTLAWAR